MLGDKDLDKMLNAYRVPALDPDVVIQAVHHAVHRPAGLPQKKRGFRFMLSPLPAFVAGGAVAVAAMVFAVLPLTGMQIRPALNIDAVVNELAISQQMAENDIKGADEILGLIDGDQPGPGSESAPSDPSEDAPIWDMFMGRS